MATSGGVSASGAMYEAILIDKVTGPVDKIIAALDKLEAAFKGAAAPAADLNKSMNGIAASLTLAGQKSQSSVGKLTAVMTKARTAVLSVGQGISQGLSTAASGFRTAGIAASAFGAAGIAALWSVTKAAGAANETLNRFMVTFGGAPGAAAWADSFARSMYKATSTVQETASVFGDILKPLGDAGQTLELSKALTALTFDLASYYELSDSESANRLRSGILGSIQATERLSVQLRQARLEATALNLGVKIKWNDLSEGAKQILRVASALEQTVDKQGDLAKTADSWSNSIKAVTEGFKQLRTEVGQSVIKALGGSVQFLRDAMFGLADAAKQIPVQAIKQFVAAVFSAVVIGAGLVILASGLAMLAGVVIVISTLLSGLIAVGAFLIALGPIAIPVIGLMIAGVLTLVLAFQALMSISLVKMLDNFRIGMDGIFRTMTQGITVLADAVKNQDWNAMWEVVTIAGELAFLRLIETIKSMFWGMLDDIGKWWSDKWHGRTIEIKTTGKERIDELQKRLNVLYYDTINKPPVFGPENKPAGYALEQLFDQLKSQLQAALNGGGGGGGGQQFVAGGASGAGYASAVSSFGPQVDANMQEQKKQTGYLAQISGFTKKTSDELEKRPNSWMME